MSRHWQTADCNGNGNGNGIWYQRARWWLEMCMAQRGNGRVCVLYTSVWALSHTLSRRSKSVRTEQQQQQSHQQQPAANSTPTHTQYSPLFSFSSNTYYHPSGLSNVAMTPRCLYKCNAEITILKSLTQCILLTYPVSHLSNEYQIILHIRKPHKYTYIWTERNKNKNVPNVCWYAWWKSSQFILKSKKDERTYVQTTDRPSERRIRRRRRKRRSRINNSSSSRRRSGSVSPVFVVAIVVVAVVVVIFRRASKSEEVKHKVSGQVHSFWI